MATEPPIPPPPPPPPPPPTTDSYTGPPSDSHGSLLPDTPAGVATGTTAAGDDTKIWQRAWSFDEMRKGASTWSLASDAGLLFFLHEFSQSMISKTHNMEQKVDGLVHETKGISAKVHNTFNDFLMLSNTQFIENRVYDEEETKDEEVKIDEPTTQEKEKSREELESEVIPKINKAILSGLAVLDNAFVTVEITPDQMSDEEDEGTLPENFRPEPYLELTDVYAHRKLPCYIGTQEFQQDDLVGLAESSSEDEEASDNEEMKSEDEEKSSDSEDETIGSSSQESSTATESEDTSATSESDEEVKTKKPRKETRTSSDSDDGDLFASGKSKEANKQNQIDDSDDDSNEDSQNETKEQKVSGAPKLDFTSELAAKIGQKMPKPEESEEDEQDWEESGRHDEEEDKDDLFSASVDTTSSTKSKGSKKKKHKKSKSRSSSHASQQKEGAAVAAIPHPSGGEQPPENSEVDQDDLFNASVDTTSSRSSKGSRHHKKKDRSESQLSNASSTRSEKHRREKKSAHEDTDLFGASPEGDLFEDTTSPFAKRGGMFSGGGLFDDVSDENEEPSEAEQVDKSPTHAEDENVSGNEDKLKPKPRVSSTGKKLPAGAVSIFGDHGPFGHTPVAAAGSFDEKSHVKAPTKDTSSAGLFSDDGDDKFTASQSSVAKEKTSAVATRTSKPIDLFNDDDDDKDEEEDDSLFGVKPVDKEDAPKKKKIPAGAVSIFGASPPGLFNTSKEEPVQTAAKDDIPDSINTRSTFEDKQRSLFDQGEVGGASVATETSTTKPSVQQRQKNQISLFDDHEEDEDGDDLFASIAPSKSSSKIVKPNAVKDTKKNSSSKRAISLFDDDEDDEDDDIIASQPTQVQKSEKKLSPEIKPATKKIAAVPGLFGDDEEDLFSVENENKKDNTALDTPVTATSNTKSKPKISNIVPDDHDDDEDDLFADTQRTQATAAPLHTVEAKTSGVDASRETIDTLHADNDNDLFSEKQSTTSDPLLGSGISSSESVPEKLPVADVPDGAASEVPAKPKKKIAGGVSLFGDIDIFAGRNKNKAKQPDLSDDNEDDLFGVTKVSKPVPAVAPRSKPKQVANREGSKPTQHGVHSPQEKPALPTMSNQDQPVSTGPIVATASKNSMVGKLQKTLAFNPAAMLPGAVRPPPRKQEVVAEATFDKPPSSKTLESTGKDRARVRGKRRPPTRQARRAAVESMDDKSLFGSDISSTTASNERLSEADGKSTAIVFSDSDDLFSSNSFSSSVGTEKTSKTSVDKNIPVLENSGSDFAKSFEDSVDGIFAKPGSKDKSIRAVSETGKNKSLFDVPSDDLFSTGFSGKPIVPNNEEDDDDDDDFLKSDDGPLFSPPPLDFDSEASEDVSKPKKSNDKPVAKDILGNEDDIFSPFSPNKHVESDSLPARESDADDLFSVGPSITKTSKVEEDIFSASAKDADDAKKTNNEQVDDPVSQTKSVISTKSIVTEKTDDLSQITGRDDNDLFDVNPNSKKDSDYSKSAPALSDGEDQEKNLFATSTISDSDIFATLPNKATETTSDNSQYIKSGDQAVKTKKEASKAVVDDIFGDTGSIFDDVPKKAKEKKKKKTSAAKEGNIFDDTKDATGDKDASTSKTTKKTKAKKKTTKSKISIFDDDSPNIFDDPLNATSK